MTRIPFISQSRPLIRKFLSAAVVVMALSQIAQAQSVQSFQSIRLFNPDVPTNGITLQPPTGITSYSITLPATAPLAGTALINTGSGATAWASVPTTLSTLNSNRILLSSSGSVVEAPALTNGQILVGSTGAAPVAATLTGGSGISITSGAGSITIASTAPLLPTGTTTNSTLRYNGTSWVENTSIRSFTDGSLEYGSTSVSIPSATPVYVDLGSSLANDRNPTKMKLRVYNDGSNLYGFGVTSSSFDAHAPNTATYRWNMGTGATPTEVMSLTTSRLTLPSTVDLSIKGVSYTWPTANGAAGTVLTNNGSGTLTWTAPTTDWSLTGNASTNASTNFIGTTDLVDFVVRTNNTERMRVLSGGNVGIGTTAPAAPLEVRRTVTAATEQTFISLYAVGDQQNHGSTIDFRNDGGGYYASIAGLDDASNDGRLELRVSGNSAINGTRLTSSDARLTIKRTGFVGIGTTAPSTLLQLGNSGTLAGTLSLAGSTSGLVTINTAAAAGTWTMTLPTSAGTNGQVLTTNGSGVLSWTTVAGSSLPSGTVTNSTLRYSGTAWVENTNVKSLTDGSISLGTSSSGTSTATPVIVDMGSTFATDVNPLKAKLKLYSEVTGNSSVYGFGITSFSLNSHVGTGGSYRWYHGEGAAPTEIMTLSSSRLSMPATVDLSVKGVSYTWPTANGAAGTVLTNNGSGTLTWTAPTAGWGLTGNASTNASTNFIGTTDAVDFVVRTSNTERMRITSGGNIGIGVTSPLGPVEIRATSGSQYGHLIVGRNNPGGLGGQLTLYNASSTTVNSSAVLAFGLETSTVADGTGVDQSNAEIRAVVTGAPSAATDLRFSTWSGVANNVNLVIAASGNIGVGTVTPSQRLHLMNGHFLIDNNDNVARELRFEEPSSSGVNYTAFRAGAQAADLTYTLPTTAPTAGQFLSSDASGNMSWVTPTSTAWGLTGNASTNASTNFIGTTDAVDLVLRTTNTERMRIQSGGTVVVAGNLSLGTAGAGASTATPITIDMGSTFASDLNPQKAKLKLYSDNGGLVYGIGISSNSFNSFVHTGGSYRWYHGSGATPTELLTLSSTRLSMPSTVDLTVKGVAYTWPTANGVAGTVLTNDGSGTITWAAPSAWGFSGNTTDASPSGAAPLGSLFSTYAGTEYIGTSNATRLYFGTNGTNRGFIESSGGWSLDGAVTLSSIAGAAGSSAGSNDRILVATSAGIVNQISFAAFSAATNTSWGLSGNTTDASPSGAAPLGSLFSTYAGTEYIGTSNLTRLYFGTNGTNRGFIESGGGWSLDGAVTLSSIAGAAGSSAGSNDRILVATSAGIVNQISFAAFSAATNTSWGLSGNTTDASPSGAAPLGSLFSTYAGTEYIGTSNATRLYFGTNGTNRGFIESGGGWSLDGAVTLSSIAGAAGSSAGSNDRILVATSAGIVNQISFSAFSAATNTSWGLSGNTTDASPSGAAPLGSLFSTYAGTEYIGTSNLTRLYFGTNGTNRGFIESGGGWSLDGAVTLSSIAGAAGSSAGSNDRILVATSAGVINQISFSAFAAATNTSWGLTGNTTDASPSGPAPLGSLFSTYAGTEYIGTSNATRLYFGTSGTNRGFIESTGGWSLDGAVTLSSVAGGASSSAGSNDRILIATSAGIVNQISFSAFAAATNAGWGVSGNTTDASLSGPAPLGSLFSTYAGTEYIGTSNLTRLYFGTNGTNRGFIESGGGWSLDGAVTLSSIAGAAGSSAGSNDRILLATSAGVINQISLSAFAAATNAGWGVSGNTTDASPSGAAPLGSLFSTYAGTEYIGTSNATRLYFGTNATNRGFIESSGGWSLDGPLTFAGMGGTAGTSMGSNDRVLVATSAGAVSQVSLATLSASMGWSLSGNPTADAWNGTSGARLGTTSTQPLVLATTNATAQDIRFFTGASGANERMRIAGDGLLYVGITTGPTGQFNIASGASTRPGLVVRAAASQSANILEVQNSGGTVLTSVSSEGSVSVGGHIAATPGTPATVGADNTAITVGGKSFLRITSNGTPVNRTITLTNGLTDGQILVIRVSGGGTAANGIELADAGNLVLTGTAQLTDGSTIVLIWDSATSWFEIARSIN